MIVSTEFKRGYPALAAWIEFRLPRVKDKPQVFKAFQRHAGLTEKVALCALQHGNLPEISYRNIPAANGEYIAHKWPRTVFIAMTICDRFEGSSVDAKDPRMHELVESTLLHEMVHWSNWVEGKVPTYEAGKAFEKDAYGKDVRRYWV